MICNNCETELKEGTIFCHQCGTKIEIAPSKCPNCNAELEQDAIFCSKCGTKINSETSTSVRAGTITSEKPEGRSISLPEIDNRPDATTEKVVLGDDFFS